MSRLSSAKPGERSGPPRRTGARRAAGGVLLVVLLSPAVAGAQSVWALTPYRVRLYVALEQRPEFSAALQADLCAELVARADATVGAPWDVTATPAPLPLRRRLMAAADSLALDAIPAEALKFDKVMFVAVAAAPEGYRVSVRELDVRTRLFGSTVRLPLRQPAKLRDTVLHGMLRTFAPLARVDQVDGRDVRLRLRAAALPTREPGLALVKAGDVFRPVLRFNARDGSLRETKQHQVILPREIEWTYLAVEEISPEEVRCRLYTGLRTPLSGRRRGRTEPLALAVVPPEGSTTLTLQSRSRPHPALAGYDVYVHAPGCKTTALVGRSDRQGRVTVLPGESPLRVLLVKHGGAVLARLPMVPGLKPQMVARLANDEGRLAAEGVITGLQERLVDLVARRQVLLARTRARIEAGKLDEARALIDEMRQLPTGDDFTRSLTQAQETITSDDPVVQQKIDSLFQDTQKLVDQHLGGEQIEAVWQQWRKARGDTGV